MTTPVHTPERRLGPGDPDVRLMLRVREGEPGAFEDLVLRYRRRLVGLLARRIGSAEEAEDLAQEVFLRVYRVREGYTPRSKVSTWLFTIASNLAANHLRGKARRPTVALLGPGPSAVATADPIQRVELAEVVRDAIAGLDDDQRLAVRLRTFEGLSHAEIAAILGRTEAAVKSLLARARHRLRGDLEPYLHSGRRAPTA